MEILTFLNWENIATFSGAVVLTVLIVQMLKLPLDKVWKIPTNYLVYAVCLIVMLLGQYFIGGSLKMSTIVLTAFSAIIGSFTAMSLYRVTIELPEQKKLEAYYNYLTTGSIADTEAESSYATGGQGDAATGDEATQNTT